MRALKAAPGRPAAYSRDDIVDCALKMLARDGVEALTLRGVARELGCLLGTINYHFDNLADLEDSVAARLVARLPAIDAAHPGPLREQLVELGLAYIDVHSMHPQLRHVVGPASIEIAARQLRQGWRTLQKTLGLSEANAMLCIEVISGLAYNRGTEMHRLRNGGEPVLRLSEELTRKVGIPAAGFTAASFTAKNLETYHRQLLGTAIDALLCGFGVEPPARPRATRRKASS